ncbi:hypothetical protein BCR44DRAFT_408796 [Catenaria anguillulae PL171]|uniref:Uncharacterized protein n=1 Tax=Catenaria anguillulae PL171 TaxID=765915 RepID=A0A1Y2H5V9_9FUNG|nr:hypothetical protein BCR44DRAFT_408796 [Catenaria anguillulae PL171]
MTTCNGSNGNPYTGDPRPEIDNGNMCKSVVPIPKFVSDGDYTIQMRIHSQGDSFNIRHLGLVDFASCLDIRVVGGDLEPKPNCPLFAPGDVSDLGMTGCEFFKDNKVNTCTHDRTCTGWFARGVPFEIAKCGSRFVNGGIRALLAKRVEVETGSVEFRETRHRLQIPNGIVGVNLTRLRNEIGIVTIPTPTVTATISTRTMQTKTGQHTVTKVVTVTKIKTVTVGCKN